MGYTAKAEAIITLNAKAAQNVTDNLKREIGLLNKMIEGAKIDGDKTTVNELEKRKKSLEGVIGSIKSGTIEFDKVLKNLNGSSLKDLERVAKALKKQIRGLIPATEEHLAKTKQYKQVTDRISQLNVSLKQTDSLLTKGSSSFNRYFGGITAGLVSITGITYALRNAAKEAAQMDDLYSDVMKTTGLTRDEVVLLNDEFQKMDTRTSREQLNMLARDAGKLGISGSENVLQFVKAANMINVALGEDLGEGAIRDIGKMAEVFGLVKEMGIEKSFLAIGSAINALGQASTASEGYLVDFAHRMSGVSAQMNMSIADTLGYASAMDQAGIKVEMGATAFQTFVMKMFSDTAKFAKHAKMTTKDFTDLLNTDANTAIKKVLRSLNESGGFAALVPIFQDLGTDGARAVSSLSAMAEKTELVEEAQRLANVEFEKGTSILNEYSIKNENAQAKLEKAQKAWKDRIIELGEHVTPFFTKSISLSAGLVKVLMSVPKEIYIGIAAATVAITAWKTWGVVMSTWNSIAVTGKVISLAYSAAVALLSGNVTRATIAFNMMKAAMSATVIGALVVGFTALGTAMYHFLKNTDLVNQAEKQLNIELETSRFQANSLFDALKQTTKGTKEYNDIMTKLLELYGPVIMSMIDTEGCLQDIEAAQNAVNSSIEETIKMRLREQYANEVVEKSIKELVRFEEGAVKNAMSGNKDKSENIIRIKMRNIIAQIKDGETDIKKLIEGSGLKNGQLFHASLNFYIKEYADMTKKIQEINKKFYIDSTPPDTKNKSNSKDKDKPPHPPTLTEDEIKKLFEKELKAIEHEEDISKNKLKEMYLNRLLTKESYDWKMEQSTIDFLLKRLNVYIQYGQDTEKVESQFYDSLLYTQDKALKKAAESAESFKKIMAKAINDSRNEDSIYEPDVDKVLDKAKEREKKLNDQAEKIREKYSKGTRTKRYKAEMADLKELLDKKKITEQEYEAELRDLKLKNATEIAQSISNILNQAAEYLNQLKQAEFDRLDAQKERELAMYGTDADKRAEIENKYEKKKREIQLRYADAEMGVKIAQTIAAGAVAVMQAWAMNPVLGAIMAGVIGMVTIAQVAAIVAQRNALKNESSSSMSSNNSFSVSEGFYRGGFTGNGDSDHAVKGPVHANEWVAPAKMVRSNPILFANLDRERLRYLNYPAGSSQGFFNGGYTSGEQNTNNTSGQISDSSLIPTLLVVMRELRDDIKKPRKNYIVNSEANAARELEEQIKQEGSR